MTEPALFDSPGDPGAKEQQCDTCPTTLTASFDGLRARGWVAYTGSSFTGKKLHVRLCPACRQGV